jgi:hypothetical protein
MAVYTRALPRHPLLGRNVENDDESLAYGAMGWPWSRIQSVEWERRIPILDQSRLHEQGIRLPNGEDGLGSCTCQELLYWFGTDNASRRGLTEIQWPARPRDEPDAIFFDQFGPARSVPLDERTAIDFYHWVTQRDPFPGQFAAPTWDDTGSSGLSTTKIAKQLGLCRHYRHGFTLRQVCTSLQTGPVGFGTVWFDSMFEPRPDGTIPVVPSSGVAGGHQYQVRKLDVPNRRFGMDQSWGLPWGVDGDGWISWDDWEALADQQGDFIARTP